jgi:asparagine synthase (glutamine-hydrolysing)
MMLHDTLNYLPDDILVKLDRASMAISLESRAPFLDPELFAFAWSLAPDLKMRNGQGKYLLRQLLYKYVPQQIVDRPKMGFGLPIAEWLRGALRDWAADLLSPESLNNDDLLNSAPINKKWEQHLSGQRNWQAYLWPALMLQAWRRENR